MDIQEKPVKINDARAIRLIKARALAENRSLGNAAAACVIEQLEGQRIPRGRRYGKAKSEQ